MSVVRPVEQRRIEIPFSKSGEWNPLPITRNKITGIAVGSGDPRRPSLLAILECGLIDLLPGGRVLSRFEAALHTAVDSGLHQVEHDDSSRSWRADLAAAMKTGTFLTVLYSVFHMRCHVC